VELLAENWHIFIKALELAEISKNSHLEYPDL